MTYTIEGIFGIVRQLVLNEPSNIVRSYIHMSFFKENLSKEEKTAVITDVIEAILSEYSLKSAPKDETLASYLDAYTKETLLKLSEENAVDVRKSWNKPKIIDALEENFLETIDERVLLMGERNIQLIKKMAAGELEYEYILMDELEFYVVVYPLAIQLGILYANENEKQVTSFVPEEFVEKIDEATKDFKAFQEKHTETLQKLKLLEKFMTAGVNMYGVMPYKRVWELYEIYTENDSTDETFKLEVESLKYLPILAFKKGLHNINGELIAKNEYVSHDHVMDTYKYILDNFEDDYYEPTKNEIDYYSEHTFDRRTLHYKRMNHLIYKVSSTPNYAMDVLETGILLGEPLAAIMDMFKEKDLVNFTSEEELKDFVNLYQQLNNISRLWDNAGYRPNELAKMNQVDGFEPIDISELPENVIPLYDPSQPIRVEKAGRNDLCPCGSGKKYKKCCWFKDQV